MKYYPIFPINQVWHVEVVMPDGSKKSVPFENWSKAFEFYRPPIKF